MKRFSAALIGLALAAPLGAQEDPVALVVRVQGPVDVRHGLEAPAPASVGEQMYAGDGVLPADGSRAILLTRSGSQQVVTEQSTLERPAGGEPSDLFARAVATLAEAASMDATLGGRQGMIRPLSCGVTPIAPRNGLSVSSSNPTIEWAGPEGQTYDLMLQKLGVGERPQIYEVGSATSFTLPEDVELTFGAEYAWTVFPGGRHQGRPCAQMRFRVISLEESVDLEVYMEEIAVFGLDPLTDGLFLSVVAYRDMGLFYDAAAALDRVETEASLSADLYLLKGEILAELGREEAARAAFDRADELMR